MIFLIVITVFIIIVFLSYFFSKKQQIIRLLKKLPPKNIGNLKTGKVNKNYVEEHIGATDLIMNYISDTL